MKATVTFLRTTLAGGILFLIPIIVLVIIIEKALALAQKIVVPLAAHIPIKSVIGLETPKMLAVTLLLLFCVLAGLFARTALARRVINRLEADLLSNLPGYEFIKAMLSSTLGAPAERQQEVVLARIEDAWQIAFLMEPLEHGHVAVFVPDAPNPQSGAVFFLTRDRIMPTTIAAPQALKCLRRLGVGANQALRDSLAESPLSSP